MKNQTDMKRLITFTSHLNMVRDSLLELYKLLNNNYGISKKKKYRVIKKTNPKLINRNTERNTTKSFRRHRRI